MPVNLTWENLGLILEEYTRLPGEPSSGVIQRVARYYRRFYDNDRESMALHEENIVSILSTHSWNEATIATHICVAKIYANIFLGNITMEEAFLYDVIAILRLMRQSSPLWLSSELEIVRAGFNAVIRGEKDYAFDIVRALNRLRMEGLLDGPDAQANCEAIAQGGGKYALKFKCVLDRLGRVNLLTQNNIDLLFSYVTAANEWHHGIDFLLHKIHYISSLTQESYHRLMLEHSIKFDNEEDCKVFSVDFPLPPPFSGFDTQLEFRYFLSDILHFCEYLQSYTNYCHGLYRRLLDLYVSVDFSTFFIVNSIFKEIFNEHNPENLDIKKHIMQAILEMLDKNNNPQATVAKSTYDAMCAVSCLEIPATKEVTNEGVLVLLYMIFLHKKSYELFAKVWETLCKHPDRPTELRELSFFARDPEQNNDNSVCEQKGEAKL